MPATSRPRRASGAPALGALLAVLVLLAAPARPLAAQPEAPPVADPATIAGPIPTPGATSREVPRLAVEIYESVLSPFCPGLLLSNCPSPSADSLRTAIAERVERGDTRAEIEAELYATYGESIRGAPKAEGLGLVAWLAPAVVLLGGGAWMYVAAPGGTPPPASASEAPPAAAAVIESAPAPVPVPVAMPPAPSPAPVVVPVIAPAAVPAPEPEPAVRPPAPAPRPVPTAAPSPAPVPPPRVEATARPPTVRPAPTPAPVVSAADQARCTDILQKASLQALSSSETDFLKRVCK